MFNKRELSLFGKTYLIFFMNSKIMHQCKRMDEFYIACEQSKCYLQNISKTFSRKFMNRRVGDIN